MMVIRSDDNSVYNSYLDKLKDPDKYSILNINRKFRENNDKTLFTAFNQTSSGAASFFDSFTSTINDMLDIQLMEPIADNHSKISETRNPAQTKIDSDEGISKKIQLKYGNIHLRDYNHDWDINQSGTIGNRDDWNDNIDISKSQHDYDYNNDGMIDGNQNQINQVMKEIINNRYFEKAEETIIGKLGLRGLGNDIDIYFSDKLYPGENKDGVRAITVSTENPKIVFDLDEILRKNHGVDSKVITHEMTHAVMYEHLKNDNQSAWFLEGAAVYAAGQGTEKLGMSFSSGGLKIRGLGQMNQTVHDINGYSESYLAFEYIENFYGKETLKEFVSNTLNLENVKKGIETTFGIKQEEFFKRAEHYAKYYANQSRFSQYA